MFPSTFHILMTVCSWSSFFIFVSISVLPIPPQPPSLTVTLMSLTALLVCYLLFNNPIPDDILGTVLSLYMQDTSQSLPSSEEVLICSSDTTAEEVSIFDLQMDRNNF